MNPYWWKFGGWKACANAKASSGWLRLPVNTASEHRRLVRVLQKTVETAG